MRENINDVCRDFDPIFNDFDTYISNLHAWGDNDEYEIRAFRIPINIDQPFTDSYTRFISLSASSSEEEKELKVMHVIQQMARELRGEVSIRPIKSLRTILDVSF